MKVELENVKPMDIEKDSAQANQKFPTNHGKHPVSHPDERMH